MSNKNQVLPPALKPFEFKEGNPGGPGRAPGTTILRTSLKKILAYQIDIENPLTKDLEKITVNEAIALKLVKRALEGNLRAIEMIFDRVDGKIVDMLQLGNMDDKPLALESSLKYDFSTLSTDELLFVRGVLSKTQK